jgi:3-hydroxybutyryl-CoA dehydratase
MRPGDRIPPMVRTVTQEGIDRWARLSGDHNPLHVDPAYAAETTFGGTIAHGHLSLAWLGEMMMNWRGAEWLSGGELIGVRFVGPVRPGVAVRVEGEVAEVLPGRGRCEVRVVNDSTGELCVVGEAYVPSGAETQTGGVR